jgi:MFS family permease
MLTIFPSTRWYTKSELNLRMSIFYSGSLVSGAFGNLIAAGILNGLGHSHGLSPWQWLYIIEGSITVAIGIAVALVLPDFPQTWKRLTPELKHVAERRLAIEAAEADQDEAGGMSQIKGLKLAFSDVSSIDLRPFTPSDESHRSPLTFWRLRTCLPSVQRASRTSSLH